jgi:hypothetical protein
VINSAPFPHARIARLKRRPRQSPLFFCALGLSLLGSACSSGGGGGSTGSGGSGGGSGGSSGDAATGTLTYNPCPAATRAGGFSIALAPDFTDVQGRVRSGVDPRDVWMQDMAEGECRIMRPRQLVCDPPCPGATTCSEARTCVAQPTTKSVGTVTVEGLSGALTMMPSSANVYTDPGSLPHPGFVDGASVTLRATGGDFAAFSLRGRGFPALVVAAGTVMVDRQKPVSLSWTPPSTPGPTRIHVLLDIGKHGGTLADLTCDVPDTGSFQIPAGLVTRLMDLGTAGFPSLVLTRRTADSATIAPGCVDFVLASERAPDVQVAGVVSCDDSTPCPAGKVCQPNLTCS